jgi:uncharacterized protein (DUF302 family)
MTRLFIFARLGVLLFLFPSATLHAADATLPGTLTKATPYSYTVLIERLEKAIKANKMGLVARASASRGAAKRGLTIPGNEVLMVFRNDYAVRMLEASVAAGFEAPLRLYVVENADHTATIIYRKPSALFAPYHNAEIDKMASELDPIIARIVTDATAE